MKGISNAALVSVTAGAEGLSAQISEVRREVARMGLRTEDAAPL